LPPPAPLLFRTSIRQSLSPPRLPHRCLSCPAVFFDILPIPAFLLPPVVPSHFARELDFFATPVRAGLRNPGLPALARLFFFPFPLVPRVSLFRFFPRGTPSYFCHLRPTLSSPPSWRVVDAELFRRCLPFFETPLYCLASSPLFGEFLILSFFSINPPLFSLLISDLSVGP